MTWSMRHHDGQEPGLDSNNGIFAIYDRMLHVRLEKMLKSIGASKGIASHVAGCHSPSTNPLHRLINSLRLAKWNIVGNLVLTTGLKT